MPLKLSAGISKKMGLPNYGSLGAVCHLEVELEASLLEHDLESLQRHVRNAYVACSQAVNDELARHSEVYRQTADAGEGSAAGHPGRGTRDAYPGGNGQQLAVASNSGGDEAPASARQLDFLRVLASQIRGLGVRRLEAFCAAVAEKPLAGLTARDASRLIDLLKEVRGGTIDLAELWVEADS